LVFIRRTSWAFPPACPPHGIYAVEPRIQPVVGKPGNDSYPSGHTSSIFTKAGVLAELFPELRPQLFDFAHRAAWSRVFGGVHYPSDLVGGWLLAEQIVVELKKSPAFQARLQAVRAEVAAQRTP
jgi:membrane-associated phospholipid phosphatase